jgi:hypothetical protein
MTTSAWITVLRSFFCFLSQKVSAIFACGGVSFFGKKTLGGRPRSCCNALLEENQWPFVPSRGISL